MGPNVSHVAGPEGLLRRQHDPSQPDGPGSYFMRLLPIACVLICVALPGIARSQESSAQQDQYAIKSNVDLVVLHAVVRDRNGGFVSDLARTDFRVYEDGVLQSIATFSHEDIPVTVGLIVDNSGSMRTKRSEVIAAALALARSSNPRDQMFVINFNDSVSFGLPKGMPFTDREDQLRTALSNVTAEGRTALYDALSYGLEHLQAGDRDKKALIVISDGADNASKHTLADIMETTMHSDAIIYTVGIFDPDDPDKNPGVLRRLAKSTGGEAFFPDSLTGVTSDCEKIALDIRNQYDIAYSPIQKEESGSFRSIRVTAKAPGNKRLSVRTRTGYYTPSKSQTSLVGAGNHGTPN